MRRVLDQRGFSLIEMMIVLLIISVLILIAIPNVTKHSKTIDEKGCEAYISMVQGQVEAHKMDKHKYPTELSLLAADGYFEEAPQCPDGTGLKIDGGTVSKNEGG